MSDFPVLARLTFRLSQRSAFADGSLRELWAENYPELFDARDLENVRNRSGRHFYEWLAAVSLYHATGWRSLVEKYQFAHQRKQAVLTDLGATQLLDFQAQRDVYGTSADIYGRLQAPDLLLYEPGGADYVFCEVKGPGDRLRPEQREYFRALRDATGREVYVVDVAQAPF